MDFTNNFHLDTYPALSPRRPELSQTGRTAFVTGGASGVGLAICRSFAEAGAARLVLVGRRASQLSEAKEELEKLNGSGLEVLTYPCDIADAAAVKHVWDDLKDKGVSVDVLVLNAAIAATTPQGLAEDDLVSKVWTTFEVNVRPALHMTDIFLKQGAAKGKAIISLNSGATHISPIRPVQLGYAASKAGLGSLMQGFADAVDPEDVQIISIHPGSVRSETVVKSGWGNAPIAWNTDTLPGDFALWAASKEARFLHGRMVWCGWDVEELRAMTGFEHPGFCRVGLQGPKPLSSQELYVQMTEMRQKQDS